MLALNIWLALMNFGEGTLLTRFTARVIII